MAEREQTVEIYRGSQRQAKYRARVDARDPDSLRDELVHWLEGDRWDPDLWDRFTITADGSREVRA